MKEGFLLQILKSQLAGDYKPAIRKYAASMGFRMYAHNGIVYSVASDDELFELKDLTDYRW